MCAEVVLVQGNARNVVAPAHTILFFTELNVSSENFKNIPRQQKG